MRSRRGWTLLEVLCVVGVLGILVGLTGPLFRALICDVSLAREMVEANCAVRRMLARLRADVDVARSLPAEAGKWKAGPGRILIDTPEGLVTYDLARDTVTRRTAGPGESDDEDRAVVWRTPRARLDWRARRSGGRAVGIEIRTAIEHPTPAGTQPKLANSHVFFLTAAGGEAKAR
jgi:prepilin-type N-terminal cleavage/methylation domain-containing protein